MIQADAHTNPFTWRRCLHVSQTDSRCDDCGAIDHGVTPTTSHRAVGVHNSVSGWSNGQYLFGPSTTPAVTQRLCPQGHPVSDLRRCGTCAADRKAALMLKPCPRGHGGQRFMTGQGSVRCHTCQSIWRKR